VAQLKGEKLMVVPSTADGFRASVSALWSLDWKDGVSFHTFTLSEDRCARLLVKNLCRGMPESVVREKLESLNIHVEGVTQLRSGPRQGPPSPQTSLCQWREGLSFKSEIALRTLRIASVGGVVCGSKRPAAMQVLPALRPHAA